MEGGLEFHAVILGVGADLLNEKYSVGVADNHYHAVVIASNVEHNPIA